MRAATAIAAGALALLASCAPEAKVEDDVIIDIEDSRFTQWQLDDLQAHFERLWSVRIAEAPNSLSSPQDDFYIPEARSVLERVVAQCRLGEAIFQHQNHGFASLHIDDLELSEQKIACIRQFERRGFSVDAPEHIRNLEQLRSKGILPPNDR